MTLRLVNGCAKLALASFLGVAFSWAMPAQAGLPPIWEPNFGSELTDLTGEDDEQTEVSLGFLFPYAGTDYANLFVGINGALQLGSLGTDNDIDYDMWAYLEEFIDDAAPVISPFNTDLDLITTGKIFFNDFGDRAVFTWDEVGTFENETALNSFQVQLFDDGKIIFGYNGILDDPGEDLLDDLDEGIVVGISLSDNRRDIFPDDFMADAPFTGETTIYQLWCYDEVDSCEYSDTGDMRPGPLNTAFNLDMTNLVFTPDGDANFTVTKEVRQVPEPTSTLSFLALGTLGAASTLKRKLKPSQSTEKETAKVS